MCFCFRSQLIQRPQATAATGMSSASSAPLGAERTASSSQKNLECVPQSVYNEHMDNSCLLHNHLNIARILSRVGGSDALLPFKRMICLFCSEKLRLERSHATTASHLGVSLQRGLTKIACYAPPFICHSCLLCILSRIDHWMMYYSRLLE